MAISWIPSQQESTDCSSGAITWGYLDVEKILLLVETKWSGEAFGAPTILIVTLRNIKYQLGTLNQIIGNDERGTNEPPVDNINKTCTNWHSLHRYRYNTHLIHTRPEVRNWNKQLRCSSTRQYSFGWERMEDLRMVRDYERMNNNLYYHFINYLIWSYTTSRSISCPANE